MPVTAVKGRPGRHAARPARVPAARRAAEPMSEPTAPPAVTLTITIPITDDALTPQAQRLIDAVRDLAAVGGQVITAPVAPVLRHDQQAGEGPEVQLLSASRRVLVDGDALPLTRLEFELLHFLAGNPRRVFSRAQLLTGVWGYEHTGERTVDVHVRRLRLKLGPQVPLITTVYGVGYRLSDDARIMVLPHD
jgi:two-component system OmpR family response regulator